MYMIVLQLEVHMPHVLDRLLLTPVHPARNGDRHELQGIEDSRHVPPILATHDSGHKSVVNSMHSNIRAIRDERTIVDQASLTPADASDGLDPEMVTWPER